MKCSEKIWENWGQRQCRSAGKVERDGRWYCGIHDPKRKAARDAAREKIRRAEADVRTAVLKLALANEDLLTWARSAPGAPVEPVLAAEAELKRAQNTLAELKEGKP